MIAHAEKLWGNLWWAPGGMVLAYCFALSRMGDLRPEHVVLGCAVIATAYIGRRTKRFMVDMLPYIAVGIGYDSLRYARSAVLSADRVLSCSLRDIDAALFPGPKGVSLQEWLVQQNTPLLDVLAAGPYTVFAYAAFVYATYLYVVDLPRARHYLWAFAIANYVSFTLWLLLPAAAPWYVRQFGCSIDLSALPNAAGLLRVDEYLGFSYFENFYSRTTSVFGAMPSMHNAYPCLGLLTAWSAISWKTKPLHVVYLVWMLLGSMYLDHHWAVDAVAGWAVAGVAVIAARPVVRALHNPNRE